MLRLLSFLHRAVLSAWCLDAQLCTGYPIQLPNPRVLVLRGGVVWQLAKGLEVADEFLSLTGLGGGGFHVGVPVGRYHAVGHPVVARCQKGHQRNLLGQY